MSRALFILPFFPPHADLFNNRLTLTTLPAMANGHKKTARKRFFYRLYVVGGYTGIIFFSTLPTSVST